MRTERTAGPDLVNIDWSSLMWTDCVDWAHVCKKNADIFIETSHHFCGSTMENVVRNGSLFTGWGLAEIKMPVYYFILTPTPYKHIVT